MILDSAIGPGAPDPLGRDTLEAVGRVVTTVCRIGCGGADEHPVSDLARLVPRLRRAPIRRVVRRGSRRTTVRVGADDLLGLLVSSDQDPELMRRIPPAVRAALGGNNGPLVRLKLSLVGLDQPDDRISEFSPAVYVATTCEESTLAWDPAASERTRRLQARAALAEMPTSAFAPFDRTAGLNFGLLPLCGAWPARERVVAPPPPLPTSVATLVLAGELDLRTPLENARRLARALAGRVVVEHGVGHQVLGADFNGCGAPAIEAFLAKRPLPACRRDATIGGVARLRAGAAQPPSSPGSVTQSPTARIGCGGDGAIRRPRSSETSSEDSSGSGSSSQVTKLRAAGARDVRVEDLARRAADVAHVGGARRRDAREDDAQRHGAAGADGLRLLASAGHRGEGDRGRPLEILDPLVAIARARQPLDVGRAAGLTRRAKRSARSSAPRRL